MGAVAPLGSNITPPCDTHTQLKKNEKEKDINERCLV